MKNGIRATFDYGMRESVSSPPTPPSLDFDGVALTRRSTSLSGGEGHNLKLSAIGKAFGECVTMCQQERMTRL